MNESQWREVDQYFCDQLVATDDVLDAALAASLRAGLPEHN